MLTHVVLCMFSVPEAGDGAEGLQPEVVRVRPDEAQHVRDALPQPAPANHAPAGLQPIRDAQQQRRRQRGPHEVSLTSTLINTWNSKHTIIKILNRIFRI